MSSIGAVSFGASPISTQATTAAGQAGVAKPDNGRDEATESAAAKAQEAASSAGGINTIA